MSKMSYRPASGRKASKFSAGSKPLSPACTRNCRPIERCPWSLANPNYPRSGMQGRLHTSLRPGVENRYVFQKTRKALEYLCSASVRPCDHVRWSLGRSYRSYSSMMKATLATKTCVIENGILKAAFRTRSLRSRLNSAHRQRRLEAY